MLLSTLSLTAKFYVPIFNCPVLLQSNYSPYSNIELLSMLSSSISVAIQKFSLENVSILLWICFCISGIEQKDERHLYLNLAKDACLDVPAITKTVVENIRKKNNEDLQGQSRFTINTAISKVRLDFFFFFSLLLCSNNCNLYVE